MFGQTATLAVFVPLDRRATIRVARLAFVVLLAAAHARDNVLLERARSVGTMQAVPQEVVTAVPTLVPGRGRATRHRLVDLAVKHVARDAADARGDEHEDEGENEETRQDATQGTHGNSPFVGIPNQRNRDQPSV